jgi:uncharacterized membrane protein (DUF373 family)
MENMDQIRSHFAFTANDQENLQQLAPILLPFKEQFADDFYNYLMQYPDTAKYFHSEKMISRRKETFISWFKDLLTASYDNRYLLRLKRIGKVHVDIGLHGYHVDAAMNYIRELCRKQLAAQISASGEEEELLVTFHKVIDINLSIITSSFQEEKMKKVFLSQAAESFLIQWSERLLRGLNLILLIGLLVMAIGVVALLGMDISTAILGDFDYGVIKALGSLLILWMMIELLHTEIEHLRGGKFHVRIFLELALVAFIRKLFVASLESKDPTSFALLLASLLVLGLVYFLVAKVERSPSPS